MTPEEDSKPIDFRVLGSTKHADARWLFGFEPGDDRSIAIVELAHVHRDEYVVVQTAPRSRFKQTRDPRASDVVNLRDHAAWGLTAFSAPADEGFRDSAYRRSRTALVGAVANSPEAWNAVEWSVDGIDVPAYLWRFAYGWAGYTDALRDVCVMAVGEGPQPTVQFASVVDASTYRGLSFTEGLSRQKLVNLFDDCAACRIPIEENRAPHPDHLEMLRRFGYSE